jgi:hypothetical protein
MIALAESKDTGPTHQDYTGRVQRYGAHSPGLHWQSPKIQGLLTRITLAESIDTVRIFWASCVALVATVVAKTCKKT